MAISIFDLFKVGIGPSSSHTVGPMRAANRFLMGLEEKDCLDQVCSVNVELYGSLALTGIGHGTDKAVMLGLLGEAPDTVDPDCIDDRLTEIQDKKSLSLYSRKKISFDPKKHIIFFRKKSLPIHPNGMRFIAFGSNHQPLHSRVYYSIGGGFVVNEETAEKDSLKKDNSNIPFPFKSGKDLFNYVWF